MKKIVQIFVLLAFFTLFSDAQFKYFVTVKGDKLMDGDAELRFISCNVPNLQLY